MRSAFLILVAVALLVGGFFVYYAFQASTRHLDADGGAGAPAHPRLATTAPVAPPPEGEEGAGPAGPGNDVWVQSLDEKMRVAFQFRASRYDPTKEGPVNVTNPQAEVFTGPDEARQVVRIEGKTGRVVMPSGVTQRTQIRGNEASAPRRGELKDVTISLFDEADRSRPLLVCRVDNVTFDNDTFRIATESYAGPDGSEVPADQVTVEVRGDDFDFDGRGLTIQWNEADRRLQLLEIAHGNRLIIKSTEMLQALDRSGASATPPRERARRDDDRPKIVLASAQAPPATTESKPAQSSSVPLYRATFLQSVRITRGEEVLASADQMLVDFLSDRNEPVSTQGRARRNEPAADAPPRAPRPAAPAAPAAPATSPIQPVVVNWVGKLRVTAVEAADAPRPAPGSLNVAMLSEQAAPVVLNHQGMNVTCAAFDYRSGDDSLTITSSKALPVIAMKLADGTTIRTPSVVYTGADAKAKLTGKSSADIPLPQEQGQPAQRLRATWNDACVLTLVPGTDGARDLRPDRATFAGDVRVDHPQLALRSESLELGFDPLDRSDQPPPNEVKARGAVQCRLIDAAGNDQTIRCDDLMVAVAPAGNAKLSPKTVVADGNVIATSADEELRCGHLTVALASVANPEARQDGKPRAGTGVWGGGEFEIQSVTAQDDVKLATRDGRSAAAQQVHVTLTAEGNVAELLGQPATLSDGRSTLIGPHIKYEQGPQRASVQGPGTLALVVRDNADQPARPVNAAWESSLSYDGLANRAELTGGASVAAPAADGSKQRASADRIIVEFTDAPQPATAPAAVNGANNATAARVDYFDLAGDKVMRRITLAGNAQVQSTLDGQRDGELRRIHLLAPEVRYDVEAKRAEVPVSGRMLVQDTLPVRDAETGNRMLGNFRGATAFQWAKDLVFDQAENRMTMSGNVLIVHEDPARDDQSFRLEAAQVRAEMIDDAPARKADTRADATDALFGPSELHLRSLSASGDIRLTAPQIQIEAQDVTYDAAAELLTARGSERQPVELYNASGVSRGSFQEVVWDARAEQIQRMREVRAQVRR